jgi:hypothetical protein
MALHIPDSYQYPEPSIAPLSARVMGTMVYALVFLLAVMLISDEADESLIEDIFYSLNPPDFITLHLFQQDGTGKRAALAESSTYRLHSAFYCLGARQCHMTRMIIPIHHQT